MEELAKLDIKYLHGVGPKRAEVLAQELGIRSYYDLLYHFPFRYIDRSKIHKIADLRRLGENGGGYGDLLVSVYVQPNRVFVRKGNDIYCDVPITFVQAALGGEITIKTIDGEQKYTIKPGTQPDTVVTLRGVGVPNLRNPKIRGNQIVTLKVKIPTSMTERQKDLLRQFYGDAPAGAAKPETSAAPEEEKKTFGEKVRDFFEKDK